MRTFGRTNLVPVIIWAALAFSAPFLPAAERTAPPGKTDPALMKRVEKELAAFGDAFRGANKLDKKAVFRLLSDYLKTHVHIYGAAFAVAPETRQGKPVKSSPYVYRSGDRFVEKDLIESYDYAAQPWYALPVKLKTPVWSEPYYDAGGGEAWMVTYSIPIYSGGEPSRLVGVVTSDVFLRGK